MTEAINSMEIENDLNLLKDLSSIDSIGNNKDKILKYFGKNGSLVYLFDDNNGEIRVKSDKDIDKRLQALYDRGDQDPELNNFWNVINEDIKQNIKDKLGITDEAKIEEIANEALRAMQKIVTIVYTKGNLSASRQEVTSTSPQVPVQTEGQNTNQSNSQEQSEGQNPVEEAVEKIGIGIISRLKGNSLSNNYDGVQEENDYGIWYTITRMAELGYIPGSKIAGKLGKGNEAFYKFASSIQQSINVDLTNIERIIKAIQNTKNASLNINDGKVHEVLNLLTEYRKKLLCLKTAYASGNNADIIQPIDDLVSFLRSNMNRYQLLFDTKTVATLQRTQSDPSKITKKGVEVTIREVEEVLQVSEELKQEKTHLLAELNRIELEAQKASNNDPTKLGQLRAQAEDAVRQYNQKVVALEQKGVQALSKIDHKLVDPNSVKALHDNWWVQSLAKANGGLNKLFASIDSGVNKLGNTKVGKRGGKTLVGVAAVSLFINEVDHLSKGDLKSVGKDALDLAIGFIPVVGGVHDLILGGNDIPIIPDSFEKWYRQKFGKEENISEQEKNTRTLFGVVGLIPGLGTLFKGGAKVIGATGKALINKGTLVAVQTGRGLGYAANTIDKVGGVVIGGGRVVGKVASYGVLGYTVVESTYDMFLPSKTKI